VSAVDSRHETARAAANIRITVAIGGALLALAGCVGLTSGVLFSQPSTLKYLITVVGPVGLTLVAGARDPLRVLASLTIVTAPFAFVVTAQGVSLTPLALFGGATFLLFTLSRSTSPVLNLSRAVIPVGLALLAPGVIRSPTPVRYALLIGAMLATGLVAARLSRRPGGLEALLGSVTAAATLQAAVAIWEFKTHHRLDLYSANGQAGFTSNYFFSFEGADRPAAAMPDPISLGNLLALALPLSISLLFVSRGFWKRAYLSVACGVIILGLALTLSRMSWVGAALGIVVVIALLPARRLTAAAIVAGTAGSAIAFALAVGGTALRQRFASVTDPTANGVVTASSDRQRQAIWDAALHVASENEPFGTGFGGLHAKLSHFVGDVGVATHAHSTYLQILSEAGAVGLAGVVVIFASAGRDLWPTRARERTLATQQGILATGALGGLAATLVFWTTDYTVRYLQVGLFIALLIGVAAGRGRTAEPR
jgi:O-antigen ligase